MEKKIISLFQNHGLLIQPDVVDYLMTLEDPLKKAYELMKKVDRDSFIISLEYAKNMGGDPKKSEDGEDPGKDTSSYRESKNTLEDTPPPESKNTLEDTPPPESKNTPQHTQHPEWKFQPKGWSPQAQDYDRNFAIMQDITGNSCCEGKLDNFAELFNNRYNTLSKFLRRRQGIRNAIPLNRIKKDGENISLIGMVNEIRETAGGYILIELEDETDTVTLLIPKEKGNNSIGGVIKDEVIGVMGKTSRTSDLIMVNSIIRPEISLEHKKNRSLQDISVAFAADIHMGSKTFLKKEWMRFIDWLNGKVGNSKQRALASTVKYVVVPGDAVEGIGIYPKQENDLEIPDLFDQYGALSNYFQLIPDYITLIVQPGNHDAVRPSLPQPALDREIQKMFPDNTRFIGNPCHFTLDGVEILSYHGQSLIDFVTQIPSLSQNKPVGIMKGMLQRRHLAPIYGENTPIAPEKQDFLLIRRTPDIFVTGHVHVMEIGEYRGITLINAATWQSQTDYQRMRNIEPHPGKLPLVNLKSGNVTALDFASSFT